MKTLHKSRKKKSLNININSKRFVMFDEIFSYPYKYLWSDLSVYGVCAVTVSRDVCRLYV